MAMAPPPYGGFFPGSGGPRAGQMLSFSSGYGASAGLDCGGSSDVARMQGLLARVRGPFTPTQWMELEHQALIYKHIVANAPVPAGLLIPITRSLQQPPVFPHFPSGSSTLASSSLGWGSFQLGYSGSTDPELGRCRRTDGKKWRCSRDAVVDQKYCERHLNRGRHRSRKHVEGRSSHAAKEALASVQPALSASSGNSSVGNAMALLPTRSLATNLTDPSATQFDRMLLDKGSVIGHAQDSTNQQHIRSTMHNTRSLNPSEKMPSKPDYAIISTGSLMNSPQAENVNLIPLQPHSNQAQPDPVHHLLGKEIQPDEIQLSISIPMENSKLATYNGKANTGLGVGSSSNDSNSALPSWIPVSWGTSIGGPLGEFFTNTSNTSDDKNKSCPSRCLNLLTDGCTRTTSSQLHSPTGVLQMTNFSSVPSSTVSSPGSLSNGLLTASLIDHQTVQTL